MPDYSVMFTRYGNYHKFYYKHKKFGHFVATVSGEDKYSFSYHDQKVHIESENIS